MLISCYQLVKYWNISPLGVLHVGAHLAEERDAYILNNFGSLIWVEASHQKYLELKSKFGLQDLVLQGLVWDESNINLDLYLSDNTQASSALKPTLVTEVYPELDFVGLEQHKSITLKDLLPESVKFNFINLDIQGAELQALRGWGDRIREVDYVYTEVYTKQLYENCSVYSELSDFLSSFGFIKVAENINSQLGWGDAFFVRKGRNDNINWRIRIWFGSIRFRLYLLKQFIEKQVKKQIPYKSLRRLAN